MSALEAAQVEQEVIGHLGYQGVAKDPVWTNGRPIEEVSCSYAPQGSNVVLFSQSPRDIGQLQRRVWSQGEASLLVVSEPTRVCVFAGRQMPPDRSEALSAIKEVPWDDLAGLQPYARWSVDENPQQWGDGLSGLEFLAQQTRRAFDRLCGADERAEALPAPVAQALLGRAVFVRYLTDRGSLDPELTLRLSGGAFDCFERALDDVPRVRAFLAALNDKFNGSVFPLDDADWQQVTPAHLQALRQIVDCQGDQYLLWKLDFSHLPIGFFSRLFELFLDPAKQKEFGAYYTPPGLVDFVLGETMPPSRCEPSWRVLDPACGSGVFLARAFHRLVLAWRKTNGRAPSAKDLHELLHQLRGVDFDARAVRVTALSLYLAMLEHLPLDVLHQPGFRLPDLLNPASAVLLQADFFDPALDTELQPDSFDRVVGNPPWGRGGGRSADWREWCKARNLPTPGDQLAPAFLWRAGELCRPTGEVAMLAHSDTVLAGQSSATEFRERFWVNHTVRAVADFTLLRRCLIDGAQSPLTALFYSTKPPRGDELVTVAAPKRSAEAGQGLVPLITPADIQVLSLGEILDDPGRFLAARYGTAADARLLRRLRRLPRLADACAQAGLDVGEGLKLDEDINRDPAGRRRKSPVAITDPPAPTGIRTDDMRAYRLTRLDGETLTPNKWLPGRKQHVCRTGPVVVVAHSVKMWNHSVDGEKRLAAAHLPSGKVYRDRISGVAGGATDRESLLWLMAFFNSSLAAYVAFHSFAPWMGARGSLNHENVAALPFIFPAPDDQRLSEVLRLVDEAQAFAELPDRLSAVQIKLDALVMDLFGLNEREQALVADTVQYAIPHFHWADASAKPGRLPVAEMPANGAVLSAYAQRFVETVEPVTKEHRGPLHHQVRQPRSGESLAVVAFAHRPESLAAVNEIELRTLAEECPADEGSIYLRRFVDVYLGEVLYCVRPNKQRFWTRSRALADAQAAFADWLEVGDQS